MEVLCVHPSGSWLEDMLPQLAKALAPDVAPALRLLDIRDALDYDDDLKALARRVMVEARAQHPDCRPIERIQADGLFDDETSEAFKCQFLRVLLPSVTELDNFTWCPASDACF